MESLRIGGCKRLQEVGLFLEDASFIIIFAHLGRFWRVVASLTQKKIF